VIGRADVLTETIDLPVGGKVMSGYLARPRTPHSEGAVIVAHELFGISAHVRDVCERLAAGGLTALAPDFYHRAGPRIELPHDDAGRQRGFGELERLARDDAIDDVGAALAYLHENGTRRVAMLGLSVGGHIAYLAATSHPLNAVAAVYPGWLTNTDIALSRPTPTVDRTPRIQARVLILCGTADHAVPAADLRQLQAALSAANVEHDIVTYPDTPHGFLCDRRDTYRPAPAEDAWRRIHELFDATIR